MQPERVLQQNFQLNIIWQTCNSSFNGPSFLPSSVAPNFVHSLDATHLMMVVNRLTEEKVTTSYAMIHDSFGVHACDVDELQYVIRDEFTKLYSADVLMDTWARVLKNSETMTGRIRLQRGTVRSMIDKTRSQRQVTTRVFWQKTRAAAPNSSAGEARLSCCSRSSGSTPRRTQ